LGLKLYELGNTAVARFDIKKEAIPILKELAIKTNQTAHLGILNGMEGNYLEKIESSRPIQLKSFPGKRISLHSSAIGKVLLAWQPKEIRHKILQTISLPRFTDNTITSRDELVKHLDRVIELGFACDDEENEPDVRCLGAPVWGARNEVIAAISIAGLSSQFTEADRTDMLFHVKEASKKLSMSCAGSGT
jgi:DNA-binding IclR family transcriptional regulator